nr:uncharacterized protein LOC123002728 [Drosophila takahashii]
MRFSFVFFLAVLSCILFIQEGSGEVISDDESTITGINKSIFAGSDDTTTTTPSPLSDTTTPSLYSLSAARSRRRIRLALARIQRRERKLRQELEQLVQLLLNNDLKE